MRRHDEEMEILCEKLNDEATLQAYKAPYDAYRPAFLPRLLGSILVGSGNWVYGREPSYLKFRAVEVIARVPYHSWASAAYTLLTRFYTNEKRAMELTQLTQFSRLAQDNETMHVIVISQLANGEEKAGFFRHSFIPMFFAFFYFWASYFMYLVNSRYSYELNYLFENHAFSQYSRFLERCGEELKQKPVRCEYLVWYGRHPRSQYEFFQSLRNDEIIHRNTSIKKIGA